MSLPNQLTTLRIILTPVIVALLYFETLYFRMASLFFFLLATLTDWYDGRVARKFGHVTSSGQFLDPLADKILVLSTLFTLAFHNHISMWLVMVIAGRDLFITFLRSYAEWKRHPIVTSISAKWKTASQMAAIYLVLLYLVAEAHFYSIDKPEWLSWIIQAEAIAVMMQVVTLITVATAIQYLLENRHHVRSLAHACMRVFASGNLAK